MTFLEIHRGDAPLVVSFPHTGTEIPPSFEAGLVSPWLARKDADWWVDRLYDFARDLGATTVRTTISRSIIDVNRDPSGASLYPGQATTELCPTTTFDGLPLYHAGHEPAADQIANRRGEFFVPYHAAIAAEIGRLRERHRMVVLYDAHSIRSVVPRLFDGLLPHFNIGTNNGTTCDGALAASVEGICAASGLNHVVNGRFKGGWTTRHYGSPTTGVHAIQMELACRSYIDEPDALTEATWPTPYSVERAAPLRTTLTEVLRSCLAFAGRSA
jgi:N-formylglutamate deformylase